MEGDGELMKMLMQADSPDEDIQGTLGDSSMGPPGGYPRPGLAFPSSHYGGMQQQLPTMGPQQQPSNFHSMNTSPMMQQDMDMVLQQQQYPQQPPGYGNGNYQGYNGGYQGPGPVSPQTRTQPMASYQGSYQAEHGYPQVPSANQAMGEFSPQAGPNQSMGITGPASLSLANLSAMSNRQHYYPDGYRMNQPVSPVRKQLQPSGGFLQPSRVPYSQQAQSYQSSSYPKKSSSSPGQNQMQGYNTASSYAPRSSTGMQMPGLPYQSPPSPYQPPHSPIMHPVTTSVPQQDGGLYGRPHETVTQPRPPFGPSQEQFQQQPQPQPQHPHSSCMFVQPGTAPSHSQYQPQQNVTGAKSAALIQRRASYPGQQGTRKMPSPPLKASPLSPLRNSNSPDFARAIQMGFEGRACAKAAAKKEKASLPSSIGSCHSAAVSKGKDVFPRNLSGSHKGLPRQKRSASDAASPSVSPPVTKRDEADGNVPKEEHLTENVQDPFQKDDKVERKEESRKPNGEVSKRSLRSHEGDGENNLKDSGDKEGVDSKSQTTSDYFQAPTETKEPGIATPDKRKTPSDVQGIVATNKDDGGECSNATISDKNSAGKYKACIAETQEIEKVAIESMEIAKKDGTCVNVSDDSGAKGSDGKDVSNGENVKEDELICRPLADKKDGSSLKLEKEYGDESSRVADVTNPSPSVSGGAKNEEEEKEEEKGEEDELIKHESEQSIIDAPDGPLSTTGRASQLRDRGFDDDTKVGNEAGETGRPENGDDNTGTGMHDYSIDTEGNAIENIEKRKDDTANKEEMDVGERTEPSKECEELNREDKSLSETAKDNCLDTSVEGKEVATVHFKEGAKPQTTGGNPDKTVSDQKKRPSVSLRCEEHLSSDDDERLSVPQPSTCLPPVISKTQGIQTIEQPTITTRSAHCHATSVKATIIAKGTSSQNNQQVMVAKTTTGQMYLIQGNILVPVQSLNPKSAESSIKANSKVIIVNPVKMGAEATKQPHTTTKSSGGKAKSESDSSKTTDKEKLTKERIALVGNEAGVERIVNMDASGNLKNEPKKTLETSALVVGSKTPLSQAVQTTAIEKDRSVSKTETLTGKSPKSSPVKQKTISSPKKSAASSDDSIRTEQKFTGRGRPPGSKDKQKRKAFVHQPKRKGDDLDASLEEPLSKRKFLKTASVVKEMASSSSEPSTGSKTPVVIDIPTVNPSKSPKKRKISSSSSPVKRISTRPRGGVDGDSWVCSLCGKRSGSNLLGDLFGPYKAKFTKEKTESSPVKDSKSPQKLSLSGRKSYTASDPSADRKSNSSADVREEVETVDVDLWLHRDCGVWSPGVFMLGRTVHGLEQAVESAAQHKCTRCSEVGATLACFKRGCNEMFHYACARDSGCSFIEDNFTIFCSTHKC